MRTRTAEAVTDIITLIASVVNMKGLKTMQYYHADSPLGLGTLVDLAADIEDMATIMLEDIEANAPLTRFSKFEEIEIRKSEWNNHSDYVHAMASALFIMISELHISLNELDLICNPSHRKYRPEVK